MAVETQKPTKKSTKASPKAKTPKNTAIGAKAPSPANSIQQAKPTSAKRSEKSPKAAKARKNSNATMHATTVQHTGQNMSAQNSNAARNANKTQRANSAQNTLINQSIGSSKTSPMVNQSVESAKYNAKAKVQSTGAMISSPLTNVPPSTSIVPQSSYSINANTSNASSGYSNMNSVGTSNIYSGIANAPIANNNSGYAKVDHDLRTLTMQKLYSCYQQLHGSKVEDSKSQQMAANLEREIALKSSNRDEYIQNGFNEIQRLKLSQQMYGSPSPPHSQQSSGYNQNMTNSTVSNTMLQPNTTASNSASYPMQHSSTSNANYMNYNNSQGHPSNNRGGQQSSFHNMPANNSMSMAQQSQSPAFAEFSSRMGSMSPEKMIHLLWHQRVTIYQMQQKMYMLEKQLMILNPNNIPIHQPPNSSHNYPMNPSNNSYYQQQQYTSNAYISSNNNPTNQIHSNPTSTEQYCVDSGILKEAELKRSNSRAQSRNMNMNVNPCATTGGASYGSSYNTSVPTNHNMSMHSNTNPMHNSNTSRPATINSSGNMNQNSYWGKITYLKDKYSNHLLSAYQYVSQNNFGSSNNPTQKTEGMKQNIHFAMTALSETPSTAKPRGQEVLDSIEKFIHSSVVPLIQNAPNAGNRLPHHDTHVPNSGNTSSSALMTSNNPNSVNSSANTGMQRNSICAEVPEGKDACNNVIHSEQPANTNLQSSNSSVLLPASTTGQGNEANSRLSHSSEHSNTGSGASQSLQSENKSLAQDNENRSGSDPNAKANYARTDYSDFPELDDLDEKVNEGNMDECENRVEFSNNKSSTQSSIIYSKTGIIAEL